MIPLVDVAMVKLLQAALPDKFEVVMANAEKGRQVLADRLGDASRNLPGVAVWRVSAEKDSSRANQPMAHRGIGIQYVADGLGKENSLLVSDARKPMTINYELNVWSKRLSIQNEADRILAFIDVYNPVTIQVGGEYINFAMEEEAPTYSQTANDRGTGIVEYLMTKNMRVHSNWSLQANYRVIHEIFADLYDGAAANGPVPQELLDQIYIIGSEETP